MIKNLHLTVTVLLLLASILTHMRLREVESMYNLRENALKERLNQALSANKEAVSRQNSKVLTFTVGLQDRMSRVEQLEAEHKLQYAALSARLDALETKPQVLAPVADKNSMRRFGR